MNAAADVNIEKTYALPTALMTCEGASFAYAAQPAVTGLNFTVYSGDYLCIVGPNGSGKSTLLRGILRLMLPSAGKLSFADGLKSGQVGYLPQQTKANKDFPASVFEVVLSGRLGQRGLLPFYSRDDRSVAAHCLSLLKVSDLARRNFGELSGGQQQRVLLARAFCAAKQMLVLDEPAAGLDLVSQAELEQIIIRLNREQHTTVVMVSHDVQSALASANVILHLDTEQKFFGSPEAYQTSGVGDGFLGCFHTESQHPGHSKHSELVEQQQPQPQTQQSQTQQPQTPPAQTKTQAQRQQAQSHQHQLSQQQQSRHWSQGGKLDA